MFESRIAKGIAWMEKHDKAWFNKINLSILCMFKNDGCVLGQFLCGDMFQSGATDVAWTKECGFSLPDEECTLDNWLYLKKEWSDIILAKRRMNTKIKETV